MRPSPAPSPAPSAKATHTTHSAKKKPSKQSLFDDPVFAKGYREAYSTIYDRQDYGGAIEQLRALGHDDFANVSLGQSLHQRIDGDIFGMNIFQGCDAAEQHVINAAI